MFGTKTNQKLDTVVYVKQMSDGTTYYVEEVRKGRKILTATTMWKKMSVQLTAESIRNSVSPNAQSDTDINIIPNPNTNINSDGKLYQRAFLASRVDYDTPSLEAIGTGEGNQAHGWGLYYALSKDVAEGYAERHGGGSYAQIFYLIFFI